uniref:Reverse transcriptase/retrotransposon-derived protein RNase H-like domain-containing protein n=1 Tax=Strigamia maritima TaxID=126957 RepID=T1JID2_STRMM
MSSKVDFVWGEAQQHAFDTLKSMLCADNVLKMPNLSQPFVILTDASHQGLGAVLCQDEDVWHEHGITLKKDAKMPKHPFRTFNPAKKAIMIKLVEELEALGLIERM